MRAQLAYQLSFSENNQLTLAVLCPQEALGQCEPIPVVKTWFRWSYICFILFITLKKRNQNFKNYGGLMPNLPNIRSEVGAMPNAAISQANQRKPKGLLWISPVLNASSR